jgi:uncharacterized protein YjlB
MADFQDNMDDNPVLPDEIAMDERVMPPLDYLQKFPIDSPQGDGVEDRYDVGAAEAEFLSDMRKFYADDITYDDDNRKAMVEDLEFTAGEQWPKEIQEERDRKGLPRLTVNRLPAYVGLVLGQYRRNKAAIKVLPDEGGDKDVAKVRQGIIRFIEKRSKAQIAYNTAHQNQVIGGDGAFRIRLDYATNSVFDQDLFIEQIPDAMSVVWDRQSVDPTGKDAGHCFVMDNLTDTEFKAAFPNSKVASFDAGSMYSTETRGQGWYENNTVRVVEYWRVLERDATLIMTVGGKTIEVDRENVQEWAATVARGTDGRPLIRQTRIKYAEMYLSNGVELLDGPYVLPIDRVPVFRAVGWEVYVGQKRNRFGLVRFLKDPQRMHNYWRSIIAEKLMKAPKAEWIAPDTAVEGREEDFRNAAMSDDPLLIWNGDSGQAPQKVPPVEMEAALVQEAGMASQDIRDVSNLHEASLGMVANEVSGKAINARQEVGEAGLMVYQDNLNLAIEECGRTINSLLPFVYDTKRTMRILGEDDSESIVQIGGDDGIDISVGRYDVTITTGPSYATKRRESQDAMLNMVNAMPQTLGAAADLIVEAQDWPDADKIAERLRSQMPSSMVSDEDLTPQQLQARRQAAQKAQMIEQLELATAQADLAMKRNQAADYEARAKQAMANAAKDLAEIDFERIRVLSETESTKLRDAMDSIRMVAEMSDQGDENYG